MKYPSIWRLNNLFDHCQYGEKAKIDEDGWVPARPLGYYSLWQRFRCVWLVFIGKADAVVWPEDERGKL